MADRTRSLFDRDYFFRSFSLRLVFLFALFLVLPYLLFVAFESADSKKTQLLLDSVQQEGYLVAQALRPVLADFEGGVDAELDRELARFGAANLNLKLFYQPNLDRERLFYMASFPTLQPDDTAVERERLVETGIFQRLGDTCEGLSQFALRFTNPAGKEEIVSSLTPILSSEGCWIVLTSHETDEFIETSIGKPFWQTTPIQVSAVIYLVASAIAGWLLLDIRSNLQVIRSAAQDMQEGAARSQSFTQINRIPEFESVAQEIDRLVGALTTSQELIRQTAEENAHAFKTPLAVIRQSLEPLKRLARTGPNRIGHDDARRSLELIEKSVEALDGLVTAARDIEALAADSLNPSQASTGLSDFLTAYCSSYATIVEAQQVRLATDIEDGLYIRANEEMLETILENLLDNSLSFAPNGSTIHVALHTDADHAVLRVRDEGPGVATDNVDRIFDRYFSLRAKSDDEAPPAAHFGLGLWIVRRNVEAMGGSISAANVPGSGLEVTIAFPLLFRRESAIRHAAGR